MPSEFRIRMTSKKIQCEFSVFSVRVMGRYGQLSLYSASVAVQYNVKWSQGIWIKGMDQYTVAFILDHVAVENRVSTHGGNLFVIQFLAPSCMCAHNMLWHVQCTYMYALDMVCLKDAITDFSVSATSKTPTSQTPQPSYRWEWFISSGA